MTKMVSDFSKGLTLWANRVVKKWLKYRKSSLEGEKKSCEKWKI